MTIDAVTSDLTVRPTAAVIGSALLALASLAALRVAWPELPATLSWMARLDEPGLRALMVDLFVGCWIALSGFDGLFVAAVAVGGALDEEP